MKAKPFLKWAGGKRQLLKQIENYYPKDLHQGKIKKYIEPFIGAGAVFFEIAQKYKIGSAYISDINEDLILTYKVIQQRSTLLLNFLEQYQKEYDCTPEDKRNTLFLSIRKHFNNQRFEINYKKLSNNWIPRAAQFIFLNKTCFNGLFRLNLKKEFNVPYGKYKSPIILDEKNILAVSKILQNVEIQQSDYTHCYEKADDKTFIYFDPPYRPISKTSNFTTYTGYEFTDREQIQLSRFYKKLDKEKHTKLMLSNSDPKNTNPNDNFFEKHFEEYYLNKVYANRAINSNGNKRAKINELLITNYKNEPQALAVNF